MAYVEAHGTGTALGDPVEAHALGAVFASTRATPLVVGSVKSNIGHAESAAGVAGFVKTVLALRAGRIPPTLHFERMNPHIAAGGALTVPRVPIAFPDGRRVAGVSAFGASGTNVHVVLEAPAATSSDTTLTPHVSRLHLIPLSARHPESLRELAHAVAALVTDDNLADIAFASTRGRAALAVRGFVVAESAAEARAALRNLTPDAIVVPMSADSPRAILQAQGRAWQSGGTLALDDAPQRPRLPLPLTPMRRERHWLEWARVPRIADETPRREWLSLIHISEPTRPY